MFYWLLKYVAGGPFMRFVYRPRYQGLENIPAEGPAILASNHLSFIDSLFIPLLVDRPVIFLGKAEYFDKKRTAWFFKGVNMIPVRRDSGTAAEAALRAGVEVLNNGGILGIYPEGTRSPDGRLYRGKTGAARMALTARCSIIPVCVFGTRDIQPPGQSSPNLHGRVRVVFGKPLSFEEHFGKERDKFVLRSITDEVMYEIMSLSGQEYVDEYASRYRARLASSDAEADVETDPGGDSEAAPEPGAAPGRADERREK